MTQPTPLEPLTATDESPKIPPDKMTASSLGEKAAVTAIQATRKSGSALKDTEEMLNLDYTIAVVMQAGVMFLEAGAEVYRAEATINRLGKAIPGVDDCISYVTVTGIMCSMVAHGQAVTRIARVGSTSRNLSVINAINQLSRNAELYHFTSEQVENTLKKIMKLPVYSNKSLALFGALGALGFAIFFNGTPVEIGAVFVIGLVIQMISNWLSQFEINQIFVNGLAAFGAAFASEWVHYYISSASVDTMIISSIMLLVPGLTMTNSIRDTVMGEYLSGVARGAEALIIATSIAVGVALALAIFMR